jgi:hypothetical protein
MICDAEKQRIFCAVDNGVTATIGAVSEEGDWSFFMKVPTYSAQEYMTSKVRHMTHIDQDVFRAYLETLMVTGPLVLVTERPLVNPKLFKATMSGVRAHEILLATLRTLGIELHATWDSRVWQEPVLGLFEKGCSKVKSSEVGTALYPEHAALIKSHGDADGILMAHYLRKCVLEQEKKPTAEET